MTELILISLILIPLLLLPANNRIKKDSFMIVAGIIYLLFYSIIIGFTQTSFIVLILGMILAYPANYWGVKTNKWRYKTRGNNNYAYYVGLWWGIVCLWVYMLSINPIIPIFIYIAFVPVIEVLFGTVKKPNPLLVIHIILTFLIFVVMDNIALYCVVVFAGTYIEWIGISVKSWEYEHDITYIFFASGYATVMIVPLLLISTFNIYAWIMLSTILLVTIVYSYKTKKLIIRVNLKTEKDIRQTP